MNAVSAELRKLGGLPLVVYTATGTIAIGALLAAALAGNAPPGTDAATAALRAVPYLQAGMIVIGVVPISQEYTGRQIGTTLTAMPRRMAVVLGKTVAAAAVLLTTSVLAVAAALGAAATALPWDQAAAHLGGATIHLTLIGLLAHAVALVLRQLMPSLVAVLLLVFALPPLLSPLGEHARWLPERAGAQLYAPDDSILTPTTGALVLIAWIVVMGVIGSVLFARRDA
jgi:ABC-type transport system involved in multi-copper enzyme maturation permease subunit